MFNSYAGIKTNFFWKVLVVIGRTSIRGSGSCDHKMINCQTAQSIEDVDPPKYLTTCPPRNLARTPKTPWLLLRHGYDSTEKFLEPCSRTVDVLGILELSNKRLYHSITIANVHDSFSIPSWERKSIFL